MEVFRQIAPTAPLVVVEAVWQYSHHVLHGLYDTSRPDPDGRELERPMAGPGRHAEPERLADKGRRPLLHAVERGFHAMSTFLKRLRRWLNGEPVVHDASHVRPLEDCTLPDEAEKSGQIARGQLQRDKAIMGVFDEGCMGMYNAIIPDRTAARRRACSRSG